MKSIYYPFDNVSWVFSIHLIGEFAEQAMNQDERELSLISSLCLRKTLKKYEITTDPISTDNPQS